MRGAISTDKRRWRNLKVCACEDCECVRVLYRKSNEAKGEKVQCENGSVCVNVHEREERDRGLIPVPAYEEAKVRLGSR